MNRCPTLVAFGILWTLLVCPGVGFSGEDPGGGGERVVAKVGEEAITLAEVEQALAAQLYPLDVQRFRLIQQKVQELVEEKLLKKEAERKGVSVEELIGKEAQEVSEEEVEELLEANKDRLQGGKEAWRERAREYLFDQKRSSRRAALAESLMRRIPVSIDLKEPELPVIQVSADDDPSLGPKEAPVTIIEFSDFQCPYCRESQAVLKEVMKAYDGKVRLVYRDFPLPSHHYARKAAEAAQCASEQGQFWPYHDKLFENQPRLDIPDLKRYAKELNLNPTAFEACLESGKYRAEVAKDTQDGEKVGISATPTFFINGRLLTGAQPLPAFQALIDKALQEASQKK
ncbi:MAG: thioredoxin domain-containing protein [candidate division NC10 bacterium]|nr:thioredoxin domain-containing protein [candidate division NC10 bacterium]